MEEEDFLEAAKEYDAVGIYLITFEGDAQFNPAGIHLCLRDAVKRGVTVYSDFSFVHEEDGYAKEATCVDCGCHITGPTAEDL